jgi:hypothetical protein
LLLNGIGLTLQPKKLQQTATVETAQLGSLWDRDKLIPFAG